MVRGGGGQYSMISIGFLWFVCFSPCRQVAKVKSNKLVRTACICIIIIIIVIIIAVVDIIMAIRH